MEQEFNPQQLLESILAQATAGPIPQRIEGIRRLGHVGCGYEPEVQPILDKLFSLAADPEPKIRAAATHEINFIGIGAVVDFIPDRQMTLRPEQEERGKKFAQLLLNLSKDPESIVRQEAIQGIGNFGVAGIMKNEIQDRCQSAFENEEDLSHIAGFELVKMGVKDHRLVEMLLKDLNSEDSYEQFLSIWGLGQIGDSSVLPNLEKLKESTDDPITIDNIESAIGKIRKRTNDPT